MEEQIKQIAERIKGLRDICDLSLESMAKDLNIDIETYRGYEEGTSDIPISVLYQIAQHFNMEMAALLTGEEPRLHTYSLTRFEKGVSVERRKEYKYQSLASNFINKKCEPFLVSVGADSLDRPIAQNSHPGQEFDFLLEGSLKIKLGANEVILAPGDSIYYDSSVPHGMQALGGQPAKFLAIVL